MLREEVRTMVQCPPAACTGEPCRKVAYIEVHFRIFKTAHARRVRNEIVERESECDSAA